MPPCSISPRDDTPIGTLLNGIPQIIIPAIEITAEKVQISLSERAITQMAIHYHTLISEIHGNIAPAQVVGTRHPEAGSKEFRCRTRKETNPDRTLQKVCEFNRNQNRNGNKFVILNRLMGKMPKTE